MDLYESAGPISTLLPPNADAGLDFVPTHPEAAKALAWMGFEARQALLDVLDAAIADHKAKVCVIAYDLNEPEVVSRLKKLGKRLRIIVDDSDAHGEPGSAETKAAGELADSAGDDNVRRQHMLNLQHNKMFVVDGPKGKTVVCGSTNFSWRGFYVQKNNALVLRGATAVAAYHAAFEAYWQRDRRRPSATTASANWTDLGLHGIDARVAFSPHSASNALLATIADDIGKHTTSSLLFSLAFLYQTPGPVLNAIKDLTARDDVFVYGISDRKVAGFDFASRTGMSLPSTRRQLRKDIPRAVHAEPTGEAASACTTSSW